jgi:drug/metabolite transporter (DMT)-like permease
MAPATGIANSRRNVGYWRSSYDAATIVKVHSAFTLVQCLYAAGNIVQKFAFTAGMNPVVFSTYRDVICVCSLTPLAFFSERGQRTPLNWTTFGRTVLLGFVGMYAAQLTLTIGISLAPAAYAALIGITTPIFVFAISAATGLEEVRWTQRGGQAKTLGMLSAVCGGVLIPLYNGPVILNSVRGPHSVPLSELPQDIHGVLAPTILSNLEIENWQLGGFLLIFTGFLYAVFWTLQAHTMKKYPAPISIAALSYFAGFLMLTPTGLLTVRDYSEWAISKPSAIISVLYVGLFSSGVNFALQSWGSFLSGPVLLASYAPLQSFGNIAMA